MSSEASKIPYGSDFGLDSSHEEPLTLRSFKRRRTETYFFVAVDASTQPELARLLEDTMRLCVGAPLTYPEFDDCPFEVVTLQFALGDTGSGSPMHFHQDAMNFLLAGRKRWWLRPPGKSAMSRVHPGDVEQWEEVKTYYEDAWSFEQQPGDVVYVPDMWGHSVLNLEPHTVCVAAEFV